MGDLLVDVTDEYRDASQLAKAQAMDAISEEAILLNPTSAIMYATRASVYIKMKNPKAANRDANSALEGFPINNVAIFEVENVLRLSLFCFDTAKDMRLASELDYDEEINNVLKKVEPNTRRIEEHHRKLHMKRQRRRSNHPPVGNLDVGDPELMAAFSDPDVMAALQDVMKNPANLAKHQANPKLVPAIAKMMSKKFARPK
ncbi:hypothetical protein DITRI_Ditri04bG0113200 [Diplodiscus trichospermus]